MSDLLSICQKPITIDVDVSVDQVIATMLKNNISRVILTNASSPAGIVSEKDIGLFLLTDDSEKNLDEVPASSIMKTFTSVNESMSLEKCVKLCWKKILDLWVFQQILMDLLVLLQKLTLQNIILKTILESTQ